MSKFINKACRARMLLLSNSTMPGTSYMEWSKDVIDQFLSCTPVDEILFIPFAGVTISWDEYACKVEQALSKYKIVPIHKTANYLEAVKSARCIMIGGGNTFHLLYYLNECNLIKAIRDRVQHDNIPYIGWSAGSNVAGPDIGTTNDMPIIWPASDKALALVPYNLNPHYNELSSKGETRIDRLNECVTVKKRPIVALAEGVAIQVENGQHKLVAPQCMPEDKDDRCVKIWTTKNGQPHIVAARLDALLCQQIENILH